MPNIEIHGTGAHAEGLFIQIKGALQDAPYRDDAVVTLVRDEVYTLCRDPKPFLRVFTSTQDNCDDLAARLKPIGIDIEMAMLREFIPDIRT